MYTTLTYDSTWFIPLFTVDATIWQHVAKLYPALVQCVTCSSNDVRTALREALLQFSELIHP